MKIPKDQIPLNLLASTNIRVKTFLKIRRQTLEEFIEEYSDSKEMIDIYNCVQNSKIGYIKITKCSGNPGYISKGMIREGFTPAFGEGVSCFIEGDDYFYYTSVIKNIDWENKTFNTLNSTYEFEFIESFDTTDKTEEADT